MGIIARNRCLVLILCMRNKAKQHIAIDTEITGNMAPLVSVINIPISNNVKDIMDSLLFWNKLKYRAVIA